MKTLWIPGIALLFLGHPGSALGDIFRWVDGEGVVHFTDDPSKIPSKHRVKTDNILKSPPVSGKPSVSTMGAPSSSPVGPSAPPPAEVPDSFRMPVPQRDEPEGKAEELRAKIAAKEQFIERIDRKRSTTLNPLGNRFVSPEDQELYRKYSEELPKDRELLREIAPAGP
ncbi:MAG: DUF4124 domain-containing protein [Thermodesulfobacteriota bacterium]